MCSLPQTVAMAILLWYCCQWCLGSARNFLIWKFQSVTFLIWISLSIIKLSIASLRQWSSYKGSQTIFTWIEGFLLAWFFVSLPTLLLFFLQWLGKLCLCALSHCHFWSYFWIVELSFPRFSLPFLAGNASNFFDYYKKDIEGPATVSHLLLEWIFLCSSPACIN